MQTITYTTITDMAQPTDTKGTDTKRDYTDPYGIRIRESSIPTKRPDYNKWVQVMGIRPLAYQEHPDGRARAESINSQMGAQLPEDVFEQIFPREFW